jgi:hypothetical protein
LFWGLLSLLLQKNQLRKISFALIAAIGWLIITSILLTLPGEAFPTKSWFDNIWMFDKWVHIGLFAILVGLWCLGWRSLQRNSSPEKFRSTFINIGVVGLAYGIVMEFVQLLFIPHRSFDFVDILADAAGCVIAVVVCIRKFINPVSKGI